MLFKYISCLELWLPFCSAQPNHLCNFGRGHYENISVNIDFGPVVKEEMPLKDISYLELWWSLCSAEQNHLCSFGPGRYEEHFCEIILNLDQLFRRCCLKIFLI